VPHKGKAYPISNQSRVFSAIEGWPEYYPTEYRWVSGSWSGPDAALVGTTGRGLVSLNPQYGTRTIRYQSVLYTQLGVPYVLVIELTNDVNGYFLSGFALAESPIANIWWKSNLLLPNGALVVQAYTISRNPANFFFDPMGPAWPDTSINIYPVGWIDSPAPSTPF
jgi:hypothetical protein